MKIDFTRIFGLLCIAGAVLSFVYISFIFNLFYLGHGLFSFLLGFLLFGLKKRKFVTMAFVSKLILDMGLFIYHIGISDNDPYYLIYLTTAVYFFLNAVMIRNLFLEILTICYCFTPVVFLLAQGLPPIQKSILLYACYSILFVLTYFLIRSYYQMKVLKNAIYYRKIEEDFEVQKIAISIVVHDIRNELNLVSLRGYQYFNGRWTKEAFQRFYEIFIEKIKNKLDTLRSNKKQSITLYPVVVDVLKSLDPKYYQVSLPKDASTMTYYFPLVHIIKNLVDNAREAYERKNQFLDGFKLRITYVDKKPSLVLEDNAGGFNIEGIRYGRSEKPQVGHGIFLATVLKEAERLSLKIRLQSTANGTRAIIDFCH